MDDALLHTENLSIGYSGKGRTAVLATAIDLRLRPGKLVAVLGANGIGKSTLLRTLTGIHPATSGKIWLGEQLLDDHKTVALAQKRSVVLTEKLPPSNLTVFELVALGRQPYTNWIGKLSAADSAAVSNAMALAQVTHLSDKKHFEISDGQLQKVLIARALAQDTPLIVLDEPTTHLDLVHKVQLFKLLRGLTQSQNKCILFSTHDIDLALELSDELVVMHSQKAWQGRPVDLIADGTIDRLFADPDIAFDRDKRKFVFKTDD